MLIETTLADDATVYAGKLCVADGIVEVSTIGTSIDGTSGEATVADLKTLWGASVITTCDYASRAGGVFPNYGNLPRLEIFET
jgi:hypothetical protein